MSTPLVSIIILNWNGLKCIRECLESVVATNYTTTEIIVVDNGSTDGSHNIAKKFSNVRLVALEKNIGFAAGNNAGFKIAKGKYIATLNNDVIVEPDWLQQPTELFEHYPSIGIVACRQMNYYHRDRIDCLYTYPLHSLLFEPMGVGKIFTNDNLFSRPGQVIGAGGASAIYRKEVVNAFGGFDERYYAYHEESDLCMRAFLDGWKCAYAPSAVVFHRGSFSFGRIKRQFAFYHERNRVWFIYKFYPFAYILKNVFWICIMELRLLRVWIFKRKLGGAYFSARYHGFLGLVRLREERKIYTAKFKEKQAIFNQFLRQKKLPLS